MCYDIQRPVFFFFFSLIYNAVIFAKKPVIFSAFLTFLTNSGIFLQESQKRLAFCKFLKYNIKVNVKEYS